MSARSYQSLLLNDPIPSIFDADEILILFILQHIRDFHQPPLCKFDGFITQAHIQLVTFYKQVSRSQLDMLAGIEDQRDIFIFYQVHRKQSGVFIMEIDFLLNIFPFLVKIITPTLLARLLRLWLLQFVSQ